MEALVELGPDECPADLDTLADEFPTPKALCDGLPYEKELHIAIAKLFKRGARVPDADFEDLVQTCRIEVWTASQHYGGDMNGRIAYSVAHNAAVRFIGKHINRHCPTVYDGSGRIVKDEGGQRVRATHVSLSEPMESSAFEDMAQSPERSAIGREVREILAGVAAGFRQKRREMASAMLYDPDFSVAAFAERHGWPRRTAYNHYRAIREAFAEALNKKTYRPFLPVEQTEENESQD